MSWFPCPAPCASERREKPRLRMSDTRPGRERFMDTNDSRQRCLPCPYKCIKTPAKLQKLRPRPGLSGPPARRHRLAAQRPHRRAPQKTVQALDQVGGHKVELLGPDGRRAGHDEHPLALARGLRLGGDDGPHGLLPDPLYLGQRSLWREPVGERRDRLPDRPWLVTPHAASAGVRSCATAPGATRRRTTPAAPAPGTCARSVVVITLCPAAPIRSTRRSRRSASSSLMTSSRSRTGGAPRSSSSAARSASRSASSASRCSPCEP